jgi:hypothetical protein
MRKFAIMIFVVIVVGQLTLPRNYKGNTSRDINIKKLSTMINDSLRKPSLKNKEIGIISFANLNNLEQVEPLGRLVQERLAHELFGEGFRIVEIRSGKDIEFVRLVGELNLTRLKEKLKRTKFKEIKSLILGTYIDAGDYVYVNAKLVELENDLVRASGEIKIRKGRYLKHLLDMSTEIESSNKNVYERFPIKKYSSHQ